jgi:hypothetical protein
MANQWLTVGNGLLSYLRPCFLFLSGVTSESGGVVPSKPREQLTLSGIRLSLDFLVIVIRLSLDSIFVRSHKTSTGIRICTRSYGWFAVAFSSFISLTLQVD